MTWPTLTVRIATSVPVNAFTLDDATEGRFADPPTVTGYVLGDTFGKEWSDITEFLRTDAGVVINRGASRQQGPYFVFESGQLSLSLDDRTGDFDPLNLSGPYVAAGVSQLLPGLPITVSATHAGTEFVLFTGYVDSWNKTYPGQGNTDSVIQVNASDPAAFLEKASPAESAPAGAGELVHERLHRLLDSVNWPADLRDIDDRGLFTMAATTTSTETWSEMQATATSCNGYLFVSVDGTVVYRDRTSFPSANDLTLGEGQDVPVVDLEVANDWDQVYNLVRLQRDEGAEQALRDEESIARFGMRTWKRADMLVDSDNQVADSAEIILYQSKDQRLRLDAAMVEADDTYADDQWSPLLGMELLTRLGSSLQTTDGRTVELDGLVRGVELSVQPYRWRWKLSTVAAPDRGGNFTLDDSALGVLGDWTATQREVIASWYAWLDAVGIPGYADFVWSYGLESLVLTRNFYEYVRYVLRYSVSAAVTARNDWEDVIGLTYAQWTATAYDYPTLALY